MPNWRKRRELHLSHLVKKCHQPFMLKIYHPRQTNQCWIYSFNNFLASKKGTVLIQIIIHSIFWNFHRVLEFLKLSISKSSAAIWRKSLYRFCWTSTSCQCEDCPPGVQSDARKSNSAHFRQKLVFLQYSLIWVQHALNVTSKLTIRLNFPLPFILYP